MAKPEVSKEKTIPFSVNFMKSLAIYQAAQMWQSLLLGAMLGTVTSPTYISQPPLLTSCMGQKVDSNVEA